MRKSFMSQARMFSASAEVDSGGSGIKTSFFTGDMWYACDIFGYVFIKLPFVIGFGQPHKYTIIM